MPADEETDPGFIERFEDIVCGFSHLFRFLLAVYMISLVGALLSWQLVEPGSASAVIVKLDLIIVLVMVVPTLVLQYRCANRRDFP